MIFSCHRAPAVADSSSETHHARGARRLTTFAVLIVSTSSTASAARPGSATTPSHPIKKLSVSLRRVKYYLLSPHSTLGGAVLLHYNKNTPDTWGYAMQIHHIYHRFRASDTSHAKAWVAIDPRPILENSNPVAAQLTGWQGTETLDDRLMKRLSIRWLRDGSSHHQ